jgi:hypothetical protein
MDFNLVIIYDDIVLEVDQLFRSKRLSKCVLQYKPGEYTNGETKATHQQARSTAQNPYQPDRRWKPGKLPAEPELLAETLCPAVQAQIALPSPETLFKKGANDHENQI